VKCLAVAENARSKRDLLGGLRQSMEEKISPYWINPKFPMLHVNQWDPAIIDVVRAKALTSLSMSDWDLPDFSCLAPLAGQISRVDVRTSVTSLSGLELLHSLTRLSVLNDPGEIDFSQLPRLEYLMVFCPRATLEGLAAAPSLRTLSIVNCGLQELGAVALLRQLTDLSIVEGPLKSLSGVEKLVALRRLYLQQLPLTSLNPLDRLKGLTTFGLSMLPRLEAIDEIGALSNLTRLGFDVPRRSTDVSIVGRLRRLEWLRVEGRLDGNFGWLKDLSALRELAFEDVGPIPSLQVLVGLDRLEIFVLEGNTTIEDGDLSVLLKLPSLQQAIYADRRAYSLRRKELAAALRNRRPKTITPSQQ
jgi:hypothetical protein